MRTRNTGATPKKTQPAKKTPVKSQSTPSSAEPAASAESPAMSTVTPKSSDAKPSPATKGKQTKSADTIKAPVATVQLTPEPAPVAAVEVAKTTNDAAAQVTQKTKPASGTKTTKRVVKRVIRRTVARSASGKKNKGGEAEKAIVEESTKENDVVEAANIEPLVKDDETSKKDNISLGNIERPTASEGPKAENVEGVKEKNELHVEESLNEEEVENKAEETIVESTTHDRKEWELASTDSEPLEDYGPTKQKEKEEMTEKQVEQVKTIEDKVESLTDEDKIEEDLQAEKTDFDGLLEEADDDKTEADQEMHDELGQEEFSEDDPQEQGEEALEEERAELNAAAKERKLRKELEIFVGGLDRDVTEEDLKRVFTNAGEVVDVRLHKDPATNKNKGYAFVRFATKEQADRALSEMKNPVIRGKRCGTAPSEDNDTLFVGNICNTWTKEAIKQKLKEYGLEGVENITLVADPKHEGLSRGFAFLEFSCHAEAMLAYKRLQKPDAVFGHSERTAKVAFAEPLREPDPVVMSQVKSVFVDGLPPHWDEDRVRETFKRFGEIARVMLARNMSTAKRKDFGFVDFTTHEAAVSCVEVVNNMELGDGNSKVKVRVRLSNPLPKTQAVKGGMSGGFRIARGGGGAFPRFGRGFGRGGHPFNRPNFQHGRGFFPRGPGHGGRMDFANDREPDNAYPFPGRQNFGRGGRWNFRPQQGPSGGLLPHRPDFDRSRHGGHGDHDPRRRQPFPPEEEFNQPYLRRHFDDPYFYDNPGHGMKRPYFMTDQDPDYVEPSTRRPRFEYPDASASLHGSRYRDAFGADGGPYRQDYYGSDHGAGAYPSFYGGDRPYGRGYYY